MEEIDIIELLKRVKEGKAPKRIEIDGTEYEFMEDYLDICCKYQTEDHDDWLENENVTLNTKIKILDKPIIEELPIIIGYEHEENKTLIQKNRDKINEIIKFINEQN